MDDGCIGGPAAPARELAAPGAPESALGLPARDGLATCRAILVVGATVVVPVCVLCFIEDYDDRTCCFDCRIVPSGAGGLLLSLQGLLLQGNSARQRGHVRRSRCQHRTMWSAYVRKMHIPLTGRSTVCRHPDFQNITYGRHAWEHVPCRQRNVPCASHAHGLIDPGLCPQA